MTRRSALVLLLALGCSAPVADPEPVTAPEPAAVPQLARRPPGTTVEVLLAGSPPQASLARPLKGPSDRRPLFLRVGHYGPPKDDARKHYGSLAAEAVDDGIRYVVREDDAPFADETVPQDPFGRVVPVETEAIGIRTILDALTIPLPERALGKGAVWLVDRPLGDANIRTTVELTEVYADGYKLVLEGRLLIPTEPTDAPTVPPPGPPPDGRQWSSTAEIWVSTDRLLPARAYGQFRSTRPTAAGMQFDVVDWSLDASERP